MTSKAESSVYIFKGDSYWTFRFPGSAPLQGYPRSSAADWLDCADALPLPSVDDISLSSPAGRQELRERRRDEEKEEDAVRRRDRHEHQPKYRQDSAPYSWTQCSCHSGALSHGGGPLTCVYLLMTWILLTS